MVKGMAICIVIGLGIAASMAAFADTKKDSWEQVSPRLERCDASSLKIDGWIRRYLDGITKNWLMIAPDANPAMLEMFRDRDRIPSRDLLPWSGEFAGKYLTSAVQVYRITRDQKLKAYLSKFVAELIACQDTDGYLGPWPKSAHLTGKTTWDPWGHYHTMIGLMLWYEETGDPKVMETVERMGDLLCNTFLDAKEGNRLVDHSLSETSLSPIHALCLLYKKTGKQQYLAMAKQIEHEFQLQGTDGVRAGDWIQTALAGKEFYEGPKPRWESLHSIMGIGELYWITGDEKYRQAFEDIWWSIVKTDRHNNGGFSSSEQAQGNPYHQGPIETCCTIAWTALSTEMLRMSGDSVVADEIELSTMNSVAGMHSPTGRWVTYNTPMDGFRKSSSQDIAFQAREGSPDLSCCSVNAARGFGLISDWALMRDSEGIVLNYYGPCEMTTSLQSGNRLRLMQITDYPVGGHLKLIVSPSEAEKFALKLRIPYWSARTSAKVNGKSFGDVVPGSYLVLDRTWADGDVVELELDMSLHFWVGEKECLGKTSVYRGPILLTYDRKYNEIDPDDIPVLDAKTTCRLVRSEGKSQPIELLEFTGIDGKKLRLCDFASAGQAGTPYRSWLKVTGSPTAVFSKLNPLRSARVR